MDTLSFILALISNLGPAVAGVETLIAQFTADFSEGDKAKVKVALDAAKAADDTAQAALDETN